MFSTISVDNIVEYQYITPYLTVLKGKIINDQMCYILNSRTIKLQLLRYKLTVNKTK